MAPAALNARGPPDVFPPHHYAYPESPVSPMSTSGNSLMGTRLPDRNCSSSSFIPAASSSSSSSSLRWQSTLSSCVSSAPTIPPPPNVVPGDVRSAISTDQLSQDALLPSFNEAGRTQESHSTPVTDPSLRHSYPAERVQDDYRWADEHASVPDLRRPYVSKGLDSAPSAFPDEFPSMELNPKVSSTQGGIDAALSKVLRGEDLVVRVCPGVAPALRRTQPLHLRLRRVRASVQAAQSAVEQLNRQGGPGNSVASTARSRVDVGRVLLRSLEVEAMRDNVEQRRLREALLSRFGAFTNSSLDTNLSSRGGSHMQVGADTETDGTDEHSARDALVALRRLDADIAYALHSHERARRRLLAARAQLLAMDESLLSVIETHKAASQEIHVGFRKKRRQSSNNVSRHQQSSASPNGIEPAHPRRRGATSMRSRATDGDDAYFNDQASCATASSYSTAVSEAVGPYHKDAAEILSRFEDMRHASPPTSPFSDDDMTSCNSLGSYPMYRRHEDGGSMPSSPMSMPPSPVRVGSGDLQSPTSRDIGVTSTFTSSSVISSTDASSSMTGSQPAPSREGATAFADCLYQNGMPGPASNAYRAADHGHPVDDAVFADVEEASTRRRILRNGGQTTSGSGSTSILPRKAMARITLARIRMPADMSQQWAYVNHHFAIAAMYAPGIVASGARRVPTDVPGECRIVVSDYGLLGPWGGDRAPGASSIDTVRVARCKVRDATHVVSSLIGAEQRRANIYRCDRVVVRDEIVRVEDLVARIVAASPSHERALDQKHARQERAVSDFLDYSAYEPASEAASEPHLLRRWQRPASRRLEQRA